MTGYHEQINPILSDEPLANEINIRLNAIQRLIDDSLAFIKIGTYRGDGEGTRKLNIVGFKPKLVIIGTYSADGYTFTEVSKITASNKLLNSGFVVNNGGGNNTNRTEYTYIALG